MKSKLLWAVASLLLAIMFGLAWAPYAIKTYVHAKNPDVKVGNIRLGFSRLTLDNIHVSRGWLEADFTTATVDWNKNVKIYGGTVTANLDAKEKEGDTSLVTKGSKGSMEGYDLAVHVTKGDLDVNLADVSFDDEAFAFKSAVVLYGGRSASLKNGTIARDSKVVTAQEVETVVSLPFELPKVEKDLTLKATGVKVNLSQRSVEFDTASAAPFFAIKKKSKAQLVEAAFRLDLHELEVNHPWVSPEPVSWTEVIIKGPKSFDTIEVNLHEGATITIEPKRYHIQGSASCNAWILAMPSPLPTALEQASGNFKGDLSFEVVKDPSPQIKVKNDCRFTCSSDPIKAIKSGRFSYMAYDKTDKLFRRDVGPLVAGWTSIKALPSYVPKAFITLEDPGFESHRGIIVQALQNSLQDNLKLGKFFRGGSTITMQLAKNLWLKRHKTIGRKAQEMLLTLALESCLTKEEILQLYLNVVEFGPNLYGIGPASKKYFDKEASKLEAIEAFYLASILPSPRKAVPPGEGGLEGTRSLMSTLASRGYISDQIVPLQDMDSEGWQTD